VDPEEYDSGAFGQLGSGAVLVGESAGDLFPVAPVLCEVDRFANCS
jgi:uncharacterized protein DUF6131